MKFTPALMTFKSMTVMKWVKIKKRIKCTTFSRSAFFIPYATAGGHTSTFLMEAFARVDVSFPNWTWKAIKPSKSEFSVPSTHDMNLLTKGPLN